MDSIFRYYGSKRLLRFEILKRLPKRFSEFRECMLGSGAIALALAGLKVRTWVNDLDSHLIASWRAIRDRPDDMVQKLLAIEHCATGESTANGKISRIIDAAIEELSWDHDDGVRFFLANRIVHGGRVQYDKPNRMHITTPQYFNESAIMRIKQISAVIQHWSITCGDFASLLLTPGDDVVGYVDSPYYKYAAMPPNAQLYAKSFTPEDHERLAAVAHQSPHRLLISYDDHPEVHRLYRDWRIERVPARYLSNGKVVNELLIRNYPLR
jgi:DNA adenine methylase